MNLTATVHCVLKMTKPCTHIFMHEPGFVNTTEFEFFGASQSVPFSITMSTFVPPHH